MNEENKTEQPKDVVNEPKKPNKVLNIVLTIIFVVTCYKMNKEFRKFVQSFMMRIPVIKNIIIY